MYCVYTTAPKTPLKRL